MKRGAVGLGALVPELVAPALRQRGFASSTILTEWREIVGPRLAQWTSPMEIRWPRRSAENAPPSHLPLRTREEQASRATLIIACPGAFALDVQMARAAIIEAVNRRLGFGCIGAIAIHQISRVEPRPIPISRQIDPSLIARVEAGLRDIEQAELRQALARLGAEIAAKQGN
jgi:hypothetical protein